MIKQHIVEEGAKLIESGAVDVDDHLIVLILSDDSLLQVMDHPINDVN